MAGPSPSRASLAPTGICDKPQTCGEAVASHPVGAASGGDRVRSARQFFAAAAHPIASKPAPTLGIAYRPLEPGLPAKGPVLLLDLCRLFCRYRQQAGSHIGYCVSPVGAGLAREGGGGAGGSFVAGPSPSRASLAPTGFVLWPLFRCCLGLCPRG